ncbi:hypothetical protein E3E36_05400 [Thermococcus sp. M36]|uniref:hypothetical protein n=1 Tax=Thermococcus sp. M36 TaxID=1638261 RepID=UPI00143C0124|nr:hypothetical protein [Thermococcus sp. M36]NJE05587.1 hypothetical protein [Thermococcus sp. M36]
MKISYETAFRAKVLFLALVFAILIFKVVYYPLLTHKVVPYGVAAPKGQIVLLENITLGNYTWKNSVDMQKHLILKSSEDYGNSVFLEIQTPGWCADVAFWDGQKFIVSEKCVRKLVIPKYLFVITPGFYWYVEPGYHLIFYKPEGRPENYELVNFTVTYGEKIDWGAFKVAYGKS